MTGLARRLIDALWLTLTSIVLAFAIVLGLGVYFSAGARDLGQWENADPELRVWYESLKQPDNPTISCCGEADAYWCDKVWSKDGQTYCEISDTRDDGPLRRPHVDIGTVIAIPAHKFQGKWGNPTGHNIVFLSYNRDVYCFVLGSGV